MPSSYTTVSGDTWDSIAYSELGDERYMGLLLLANPAQDYVLSFPDGVALTVPDVPEPDPDANLPPWRLT